MLMFLQGCHQHLHVQRTDRKVIYVMYFFDACAVCVSWDKQVHDANVLAVRSLAGGHSMVIIINNACMSHSWRKSCYHPHSLYCYCMTPLSSAWWMGYLNAVRGDSEMPGSWHQCTHYLHKSNHLTQEVCALHSNRLLSVKVCVWVCVCARGRVCTCAQHMVDGKIVF